MCSKNIFFLPRKSDTMYTQRSNSEQKEIDKYVKFFAIKALQTVVESRVGCKVKTRCNPAAKGLDWFNISLPADSQANSTLQNKVRELFGKKVPGISKPICVDIVLKTNDGNYIILETWQITTDTFLKESNSKVRFSIYNRLGVLLRSVVSISRLLPSYNLSRKPQNDYMLFCKVHNNLYRLHDFELHNSISIGSVVTNSGKVAAKVLYRNKIWLSGSFHAHTYSIEDVETLFPLSSEENIKEKSVFESVDMIENEIALAASELGSDFPQKVPLTLKHEGTKEKEPIENTEVPPMLSGLSIGHIDDKTRPVAAFVDPTVSDINSINDLDLPELPPTPPFMSLLIEGNPSSTAKETSLLQEKDNGSSNTSNTSNVSDKNSLVTQRTAEAVGFEDDFVLVELRPAFCSDDDSVGTLYRQCQSPAALDMFASLEKEDDESEPVNLESQLEKYQKELKEYEDFFKIMN